MDLRNRLLDTVDKCPKSLVQIAKDIGINFATLKTLMANQDLKVTRITKIKIEQWLNTFGKNQ